MPWENLQLDILEDIVELQQHWEDDYNYDYHKFLHDTRSANALANATERRWQRLNDPDPEKRQVYRELLRAYNRKGEAKRVDTPEKHEAVKARKRAAYHANKEERRAYNREYYRKQAAEARKEKRKRAYDKLRADPEKWAEELRKQRARRRGVDHWLKQ